MFSAPTRETKQDSRKEEIAQPSSIDPNLISNIIPYPPLRNASSCAWKVSEVSSEQPEISCGCGCGRLSWLWIRGAESNCYWKAGVITNIEQHLGLNRKRSIQIAIVPYWFGIEWVPCINASERNLSGAIFSPLSSFHRQIWLSLNGVRVEKLTVKLKVNDDVLS